MKKIIFLSYVFLIFACSGQHNSKGKSDNQSLSYQIVLDTLMQGYSDTTSWFYPSVGVVRNDDGKEDLLVMTVQKWLRGRSDVFTPVVSSYSNNGGQSWSKLEDKNNALEFREGEDGITTGMCNFTPKWHAKSKTLLGTCHSVPYKDKRLMSGRRSPIWSTYNLDNRYWNNWQALELPEEPIYYETNACADQRVDMPNGDILFPIYYRAEGVEPFTTSVIRCSFDGESLTYLERGSQLSIDIERGLFEPSLTKYDDQYYLTMRNDKKGYWAESSDGLTFSEPEVWHFDTGEELGTYNTMQHWVTHSEGLYLVYTRRGANNDHIIRHRAPLFISEVDTATMSLIKSSEKVIVPNRGARLGNFSVSNINENETWITVAELMVGEGEEEYGANGNVFAAKILWSKPNNNSIE